MDFLTLETVDKIVTYKPLWVALIVISVTQMGKMWLHYSGVTALHSILTRVISAITGALSGYLLIQPTYTVESAMFGLAIAIAISIAYVPMIKWLRSRKKGWAVTLADWLAGKQLLKDK